MYAKTDRQHDANVKTNFAIKPGLRFRQIIMAEPTPVIAHAPTIALEINSPLRTEKSASGLDSVAKVNAIDKIHPNARNPMTTVMDIRDFKEMFIVILDFCRT